MRRSILLPLSLALNGLLLAVLCIPLLLTAAQSDSHYFPQTQHWVRGLFWQYWQAHGGLAQQGYPLTEEFPEKSALNGQTYTVQYFERAVFEAHPENAPPFNVLLSQLGKFELDSRYPNGSNPAAAPVAGGAPVPATVAPAPILPTATSGPVVGAYAATASVDKPNPTHNSYVTVTGRLTRGGVGVAGATMQTIWHYKTTDSGCAGSTDGSGTAACSRDISRATSGYTVVIDVSFVDAAGAELARAETSFTPQ